MPLTRLPPLLTIRIAPQSEHDRNRLHSALKRLMAEDPALSIVSAPNDVLVAAVSEVQLDIAVDRLKREFGVEARVGRPQVVYLETLTAAAEVDVKFSDPAVPSYAHVRIRVQPGERGTGCVFDNAIINGSIPPAFIMSIEAGIRSEFQRGIVSGYPVVDVRVTLTGGSYHETDSSENAFRIAAARALGRAARRAAPVVLEPLMHVSTSVPGHFVQSVARDLLNRGGRVNVLGDADDYCKVIALVPLAALFGYRDSLRQIAGGKGNCEMHFIEYAPIGTTGGSGADGDAVVGAPLRPRPAPRTSTVALPEPEPERDDDSL